jgi:hypothetical protein
MDGAPASTLGHPLELPLNIHVHAAPTGDAAALKMQPIATPPASIAPPAGGLIHPAIMIASAHLSEVGKDDSIVDACQCNGVKIRTGVNPAICEQTPKPAIRLSRKNWHSQANGAVLWTSASLLALGLKARAGAVEGQGNCAFQGAVDEELNQSA